MIIPIGILFLNTDTKERVFYEVNFKVPTPQEVGKVIKQPTPEEDEIAKESKPDFSLGGILDKHKQNETLPKNPLS